VNGQSVIELYLGRYLISSLRELELINYLPIKIKMPAMSAKTPITIAPMPM
jgi:hypothetical protein